MTFLEYVKRGEISKATALVETVLKQKTRAFINEARAEVAGATYGTDLTEELVIEAIENPNTSGQGHDPDHKDNPYHDTLLKHGYEYSHTTPVNHSAYSVGPKHPDYKNQDIRMHHAYKHKDLKDHVVGVNKNSHGEHVWQTHRLGNSPGSGTSGRGVEALTKHLKGHLARAKKLYGEKK